MIAGVVAVIVGSAMTAYRLEEHCRVASRDQYSLVNTLPGQVGVGLAVLIGIGAVLAAWRRRSGRRDRDSIAGGLMALTGQLLLTLPLSWLATDGLATVDGIYAIACGATAIHLEPGAIIVAAGVLAISVGVTVRWRAVPTDRR